MSVVAIVGPTASGKSRIAEVIAGRFGATIVSVDSMQVYRGMDIGTAKPSLETRRAIPHAMIDVADPWDEVSVKQFQELGRAAMRTELERGGRVLIVGGSGLHFRSLVDPMSLAPTDPDRRADLALIGDEGLRDRLLEIDPEAAQSTDLDNPRRVLRAVEVYELTGDTPSDRARSPEALALAAYEPDTPFVGIGVDAGTAVADRVSIRFRAMLSMGLVEEVAGLADTLGLTASQAVGYREVLAAVRGEASLDEAVERAIRATTALAKRQRTFFGRDPRIVWQPWQDDVERRVDDAVAIIEERTTWTS